MPHRPRSTVTRRYRTVRAEPFRGESGARRGLRPFDEPRQERRPAAVIPISPGLAFGPERLPAAVLDRDPGAALARRLEADLDLGGVGAVPAEVPQVAEPARRLPDGHLAPVVLDPARRPLEDPAARARLQDDGQVVRARHGVVGRPPPVDLL